jgi:hypothetical protein
VAEGRPERAAQLFAAAEALRQGIHDPRPWVDPIDTCDQAVAATRTALGEDRFAAAWAAGRAMSPEKVLDEALECNASPRDDSREPTNAD